MTTVSDQDSYDRWVKNETAALEWMFDEGLKVEAEMKAKGIPMSEPEPTMAQKKKARKKAQKEALREAAAATDQVQEASDDEVDAVSEKLMRRNRYVYEELAK